MLSPAIYGAGSKLMGGVVDNTLDIKLNGTSIGQGAVIEGTSYLPVRSAAKALGLEVNVDSKQVNLYGKSSEENSKLAQEQQADMDKTTTINTLTKTIEISKKKIAGLEAAIVIGERVVYDDWAAFETVNNNPQASAELKAERKQIFNSDVAALDTKKATLAEEQNNLTDLEAQLAELQQ